MAGLFGGGLRCRPSAVRSLPLLLALLALQVAAFEGRAESASPASAPAAEPQTFRGRGVYYFEGPVRSPIGDIGSRSPFATNRLALDDEFSEVRVDRANHRILFRNDHRYGLNELVGCLLLLGRGTTASGREIPVAVHLKIHKTGNRFMPALHPHPTVRQKVVSAVFAPFDVVLSNGKSEKSALTPARVIEAVREPELSARLAKIFVRVTDHLEGATLAPEKPGSALVDLSIGFGGEKEAGARASSLGKRGERRADSSRLGGCDVGEGGVGVPGRLPFAVRSEMGVRSQLLPVWNRARLGPAACSAAKPWSWVFATARATSA
jgi:hypothetical protein